MKSTFRSTAAAASVLLASVGAMMIATPAAAQSRTVVVHQGARAVVVDERGGHDRHPPQIMDVTPSQGERVSERGWTRISARIGDRGTGVHSVQLRVDGRDVSPRVRVEDDLVRYAEDLPSGRHNAELVVRDRAGNTARRSWSFEVAYNHRHDDRHDR